MDTTIISNGIHACLQTSHSATAFTLLSNAADAVDLVQNKGTIERQFWRRRRRPLITPSAHALTKNDFQEPRKNIIKFIILTASVPRRAALTKNDVQESCKIKHKFIMIKDQ